MHIPASSEHPQIACAFSEKIGLYFACVESQQTLPHHLLDAHTWSYCFSLSLSPADYSWNTQPAWISCGEYRPKRRSTRWRSWGNTMKTCCVISYPAMWPVTSWRKTETMRWAQVWLASGERVTTLTPSSKKTLLHSGDVRKKTIRTTWCLAIQHVRCYEIYILSPLASSVR